MKMRISRVIGIKIKDKVITGLAKKAVEYIPGTTLRQRQIVKSVIEGASIVKDIADVVKISNNKPIY